MRLFLFASVALGLSASAASAAPGFYGRLEAGVYQGQSSGVITDLPLGGFIGLPTFSPDNDTDTGFAGFAAIGSDLASGFKIEGEVGYASAALSDRTDISELTAMANVLFELGITKSIDLLAGVGLGFTNYSWDSYSAFAPGSTNKSDTSFAYQAILGMDVGIADGMDLTVRYRYRMQDVDMVGVSIQAGSAFALANLDSYDTQTLSIGLTFGL